MQPQLKKPPASVGISAIDDGEARGLKGVIDAAMRIAESRAQKEKLMQQAILADDVETALALACELAGFSQQDAVKRAERLLSLTVKTSA